MRLDTLELRRRASQRCGQSIRLARPLAAPHLLPDPSTTWIAVSLCEGPASFRIGRCAPQVRTGGRTTASRRYPATRHRFSNWIGRASWWLTLLYDLLVSRWLSAAKLFANDTTLPALDPDRGRTKTGRLWCHGSVRFRAKGAWLGRLGHGPRCRSTPCGVGRPG